MAWKGDPKNPVPNIGNVKSDLSQEIAQQSSNLSEKKIEVNRAYDTRRDNDKQKDNTVTLIDIDTTIMNQLEKFQISVIDEGDNIKVPIYYASPEKWKSIQKDGVIRDYNGKLILPAVAFQRTNSEKDEMMRMFNRYLNYPVMRQYSEKNRYTRFSTLMGQNIPVREVYDVIMPDHMVFTYHFIIWTEYIEQMNTIIERLNFETEDYWGSARGLRFRTRIDSFAHTVELQVDQDRLVKTEFDLMVNGYLLPDRNFSLSDGQITTQKWFSPKKIILGTEVIMSEAEIQNMDTNREKWRSQAYPNLPADEIIPAIPFASSGDLSKDIKDSINQILESMSSGAINDNNLKLVATPPTMNSPGQEGTVSYDAQYFYIYSNGGWKRVAIAEFS